MTKPFNIHDWQAKQRLTEESSRFPGEDEAGMAPRYDDKSQESMSNASIRALQMVVGDHSLNKILNTLSILADKIGKHDESKMIKDLATTIQDFEQEGLDEMSTTGTGASFNAGSGEGYMTPNAFKKKKK
jgi:hypothetical protein